MTRKEHRVTAVNHSALWHELCQERRCDARQFRLHYLRLSRRFYSRHRNRPNCYLVFWGSGESEKMWERKASSWRDTVTEGTSTHLCAGPDRRSCSSFILTFCGCTVYSGMKRDWSSADWPTDRMTGRQTDWITDRPNDRVSDWLKDHPTKRVTN
jgi:hypothetical protein